MPITNTKFLAAVDVLEQSSLVLVTVKWLAATEHLPPLPLHLLILFTHPPPLSLCQCDQIRHFGNIFWFFCQMVEGLFTVHWNDFGQPFNVVHGQILKNNIAIWSPCSLCTSLHAFSVAFSYIKIFVVFEWGGTLLVKLCPRIQFWQKTKGMCQKSNK